MASKGDKSDEEPGQEPEERLKDGDDHLEDLKRTHLSQEDRLLNHEDLKVSNLYTQSSPQHPANVSKNHSRRRIFGNDQIYHIYTELADFVMEQLTHEDREFFVASDKEWRLKIYFQMVEEQRILAKKMSSGTWLEQMSSQSKPWSSASTASISICDTPNRQFRPKCQIKLESKRNGTSADVRWTFDDLLKAAKIFQTGSVRSVKFGDDEEMRRVYSLLFDVLRYQNVLNQTLHDIFYFQSFPEIDNLSIIWLLLYDLQARKFLKRDTDVTVKMSLIDRLVEIDRSLWDLRVKLAAAIARIRIKSCALSLNDLLPSHLRDERLSKAVQPVNCWVNSFKVGNIDDVLLNLNQNGFSPHEGLTSEILRPHEYRWDSYCPEMLMFHYQQRVGVSKSALVQGQNMIIQDRSFCLAPAMFTQILKRDNLSGQVLCTHLTSIRATVYLCALLSKNRKTKVHVFGAGERKQEYENYLDCIGVTNCTLYSGRLIDFDPQNPILESVIAVLANPPNSCSAVNDPIDMLCNQGGDLNTLEVLTESEVTEMSKERITNILNEQLATLKFVMSKPQIQFILYETHSLVDAENTEMVRKTIAEINETVRLYHQAQQKPRSRGVKNDGPNKEVDNDVAAEEGESAVVDGNNNEVEKAESVQTDNIKDGDNSEMEETLSEDGMEIRDDQEEQVEETFENAPLEQVSNVKEVQIPSCDLFELGDLPDLCFNMDGCLNLSNEGCYLAYIRRKEITRLDEKFMIEVAEQRGLFGDETAKKAKEKPLVKEETLKKEPEEELKPRKRVKKEIKLDRITSDTHTSLIRRTKPNKDKPYMRLDSCTRCPKHRGPAAEAKIWWHETFRYIKGIRDHEKDDNIRLRASIYPDRNDGEINNNVVNLGGKKRDLGKVRKIGRINSKLRLTRQLRFGKKMHSKHDLHTVIITLPIR